MFNFRGGQPPVSVVECGGRAVGKLFIFTWRPGCSMMFYGLLGESEGLSMCLITDILHIVTLVIPINKLLTC